MITTARQILLHVVTDTQDHRASHLRKRRGPAQPCRNVDRGCPGMTGEKRAGRGWCQRCYDRWSRHGDSWHHSGALQYCTQPHCFMRDTPGHP